MNKLISKLKQQAGIDYNPDQEGLDLFAELIVRECADIQMKRSCERHGYDKYEDAKEIKEHFGIEE